MWNSRVNWRNGIVLLALAFLGACATVSFDYPREDSFAIDPNTPTELKSLVDEWRATHPGPSGFYPLIDGMSALGARLKLIDAAETSIDVQTLMMKRDSAGQVVAGALMDAADRGVRVRFLIDDIFTTVKDTEFEVLDAHENIEVRLYNPISRRGFQVLNFLADFKRANRRMHNKSFTVDNQVTIVGGRNFADEYFALGPTGEFLDLDVIGFGPVAADVSETFDIFWNDERTLPLSAISSKSSPEELEAVRVEVIDEFETAGDSIYEAATKTEIIRELVSGDRPLYSAPAEVITDDPEKLVSEIGREHQILANRLAEVVDAADEEVLVFTPYLVPLKDGLAYWKSITDKGVRVVMVTNSLMSNNHPATHSAYVKYRKPLLRFGVELYEARANAVEPRADGTTAEEHLTLHTKAIIIDRRHVFIGSLNLDPRAIEINSEMGVLIDSSELGTELAGRALDQLPEFTYRVELDEGGKLLWRAEINGVEVVERSEPLASGWKKFEAFVLKIVPDRQL